MNQKVINALYLIALVVCTMIQNCKSSTGELTSHEIALITNEVKMRMNKEFEDERSLVPGRMTAIYADNEDFVFGGDGELFTDKTYLTKSFSEWADKMDKWLYFNINKEYVYVISRDAASYTVAFDWAIKTRQGDTLVCKQGAWTYVLKKTDGEWKSVHCNGTHVLKN